MTLQFFVKLVASVFYTTASFALPPFLAAWTIRWPRAWVLLGVVFVGAVASISTIIVRIHVEERLLRRELDGYEAYMRKVRWRVAPGVW